MTKGISRRTQQVRDDLHLRLSQRRSGGQPLPETDRSFMGKRFGVDFSGVRVHTDRNAVQMSRELNAQAFTHGRDIYFGAGRYSPGTSSGKRLLAHELTHVVQQRTLKEFYSSPIAESIFQLNYKLIQCTFYTRKELSQYLDYLKKHNKIEDRSDSDDKAIAVVHWWEDTQRGFKLDKKIKSLLILEMLSGFTGNEEEQAILELLERSSNDELEYIFVTGRVTPQELESNFHGKEFKWLKEFFDRRFKGGWKAAIRGELTPIGQPIRKKWPLPTVFPERAEGKASGETIVKLRKYIKTIKVKFISTRDISRFMWTFAAEKFRKSFHKLKNHTKIKREDFKFDVGTAKAIYNDTTEETFDVSGGAIGSNSYKTHRTGTNRYLPIYRKGGTSYVNPKGDPMPYASFFYQGQAFHGCGSRNWLENLFAASSCLDIPSHGCIHVENSKIEKLYPFIIIGKTKVKIT